MTSLQPIKYDYLFKVLFEGATTVGKTSTSHRYIEGNFRRDYIPTTIGIDFRLKTVTYENKIIKLQLWDTRGQERFRSVTKAYYRGSDGVLLMYDVTSRWSFEAAEKYFTDFQQDVSPSCQFILLGNKVDAEEARTVTFAEGFELASKLKMPFFEISAKTGYGVDEAFNELLSLMLKASEGKIEKEVIKHPKTLEDAKDMKDSEHIQRLKKDFKTESKNKTCF